MRIIVLIVFCALLIPSASADLGPKPTVRISVTYDGALIPEPFNATLLGCSDSAFSFYPYRMDPAFNVTIPDPDRTCVWSAGSLVWGGDCAQSVCRFGYHPPAEFRFLVALENRTFLSEPVYRSNFHSVFRADLHADGSIRIEDTTPITQNDAVRSFLRALIITLILEFIIAWIFARATRTPQILKWIVPVNLMSLPIVWFVFPLLNAWWAIVVLAETFAVSFEALVLARLVPELGSRRAWVLSLIMNATSFFIGGFILLLTMMIF